MRAKAVLLIVLAVASGTASAQQRESRSVIRGRVTDSSGNTMPGAAVVARPASGGPLVRVTTTVDGHYQVVVGPGSHDIVAAVDGFEAVRVIEASVQTTPFELDFRLSVGMRLECVAVPEPPYGTVEGTVTDAQGFPLPFAIVEVRQLSGTRIYGGRYLDAFGYADGEGHYSANAPAGHLQVSATYPGYVAQPRDISLSVGKKESLDVSAAPAGRRTPGMETLRSFTNCGRLGFRRPAPAPTSRVR